MVSDGQGAREQFPGRGVLDDGRFVAFLTDVGSFFLDRGLGHDGLDGRVALDDGTDVKEPVRLEVIDVRGPVEGRSSFAQRRGLSPSFVISC